MRRINLEPLMTLSDGPQLVISTQQLRNGDFSCVLYSATVEGDDRAVFQIISNHLAASTCLGGILWGIKEMPFQHIRQSQVRCLYKKFEQPFTYPLVSLSRVVDAIDRGGNH